MVTEVESSWQPVTGWEQMFLFHVECLAWLDAHLRLSAAMVCGQELRLSADLGLGVSWVLKSEGPWRGVRLLNLGSWDCHSCPSCRDLMWPLPCGHICSWPIMVVGILRILISNKGEGDCGSLHNPQCWDFYTYLDSAYKMSLLFNSSLSSPFKQHSDCFSCLLGHKNFRTKIL